ncbi:MAG: type II secretion system major pseudopilin GspG [Candidatus Omnitrophica bacterium]|nr:type II secretion system major pseudopilin GspG [Candidatus Omnitrophota bacterium]
MNLTDQIKISESKGFTLVEIMLVVIIIAALAAMVVPRFVGRGEQAKVSVARADVDSHIPTALKLYELDNGRFPTTGQGLSALQAKPDTPPVPKNWAGPYLEKKPVDPWGSQYVYASPGKHRSDFDLYSEGADSSSTEDDIKNWE